MKQPTQECLLNEVYSHQEPEQNGRGQRLEGYLSFLQRISLAVA